jgi:hypothetical protein
MYHRVLQIGLCLWLLAAYRNPHLSQKADSKLGENAYWAAIFPVKLTDNNEVMSGPARVSCEPFLSSIALGRSFDVI